ncbi:hypothetical protein CLF_112419 [Clonorchis sinensis]|uniref:Uncharacterized protein n=1 Tax=Clonorchis sinensis TaxID=79923 RepID=G7YWD2_CLOSI|nr:hypothetical protein CLF_112419 [Clonorchis sinensis]
MTGQTGGQNLADYTKTKLLQLTDSINDSLSQLQGVIQETEQQLKDTPLPGTGLNNKRAQATWITLVLLPLLISRLSENI